MHEQIQNMHEYKQERLYASVAMYCKKELFLCEL